MEPNISKEQGTGNGEQRTESIPSKAITRTCRVSTIVGTRGTGKSHYIINDIIPAYQRLHPRRLILIVDTIDHPMYADIPLLKVKDFASVKYGAWRIFAGDRIDELLRQIYAQIRNALIIFEDASKYIPARITTECRAFILNSKQRRVDAIYMFHGFTYAPLEIWRIVDSVTIFKCESPVTRKIALPHYALILETWQRVMKEESKYAHEHVKIY